jgi:hypothetical protein
MLTYSIDHEPVKEWRSENEIKPDVEEEDEQVEEENEEIEAVGKQVEEEIEEMEVEEREKVKEETEETIVAETGEQVEVETEETIVVAEGVLANEEPESITTALLQYTDPKNSPNPPTLSEEILKKPRCREIGRALHGPQLRRSRELAKSPIVRGGQERATMHSSWRSTPWSTLLNSSEAPRI